MIRLPLRQGGFGGIEVILLMFPHLFHKRSTEKRQEKADISETLRTLIDARFDRIEQKVKAIELEWADVYDKIMLLYDRTRKRIKASQKAASEEQPSEQPPVSIPPISRDDVLRAWMETNGERRG